MTASTGHGPRYPGVVVDLGDLHGPDGNSFAVLIKVSEALAEAGVPEAERHRFSREATSGDRRHLMVTVLDWVTVTGEVTVDD
jgi:ABC-type microcin C transport system duplicated ATPase subunit YejF